MNRIELLSPAGDLERLKVTLLYGADAVYIGGKKYSLRANATNFTIDEIKEGCIFAHKLGKKVYLTLNIVLHNEELDGLSEYIKDVVDAGIDAFIVSDPYVMSLIKEIDSNVEVHVSTQASITNTSEALFYKSLGVERIVLARELSCSEIKSIIDEVGIEVETFIHGAMCTCMSGRCTLSNYLTGRDANRGGCSQVCRFSFDTDNAPFTMATKDLNMAFHIKDLINIGVSSLKVEGRMRSLYYLATVIGTYRKIIDDIYDNSLTLEKLEYYNNTLSRVANREVSTHYFEKEADYTDQYYTGRSEVSNQDYLGLIIDYDEEMKSLVFLERNYFEVGDKVEIFTPNKESFIIEINKLYDEDNNEINVGRHPGEILKIPFEKKLPNYSMIRLIEKKGDTHGKDDKRDS